MTMEIIEFLDARIAEDEAAARDVMPAEWTNATASIVGPAREHMDNWGPGRVLAECKAKRDIIGVRNALAANNPEEGSSGWFQVAAFDTAIRQLAAVFRDHPDYAQLWRP
jgi:hypothetical protein